MATKKFRISGENLKKGGINNTRTILTSAGVVTLGAAGAAYMAGYHNGSDNTADQAQTQTANTNVPSQTDPSVDNNNVDDNNTGGSSANIDQGHQHAQGTHTPQNPTNTPSKPTTADKPQEPNEPPSKPTGEEPQEPPVDPDKEALRILEEEKVDPGDIEYPTVVANVEEFKIMYTANGREVKVAEIMTPDGEYYLLADTDGDGFYTDVYDMNGDLVGEAEGNLVYSDLENLHDQSHGYLAYNPDEPEPIGDDPTKDILDTENPNINSEVAENQGTGNNPSPEQPTNPAEDLTEEELLALLLADVQETSGTGVVEINTSTQPDPDEPIETVYGPATDPIDDIPEDVVDADDTDDDGPDYYDEDVDDSAGASFDEDTI